MTRKPEVLSLLTPPGYKTIPELARDLGLSRQRVHKLIQERVPYEVTIEGRIVVRVEDVPALAEKRRGGRKPKAKGRKRG